MNIAVVGLGLIGGSMAKCIKRATRHTVLGADISEPALLKAELLGAIDARLTDETLATCDLVIVALYPRDTVDYILSHAHLFRPGAPKSASHTQRLTPAQSTTSAPGRKRWAWERM